MQAPGVQQFRVGSVLSRNKVRHAGGALHAYARNVRLSYIQRLVTCKEQYTIDLDNFLLSDDHPAILAMLRDGERKAAMRCSAEMEAKASHEPKKARRDRWPEKHARNMEAKGFDWWDSNIPDEDTHFLYPGLHALTHRTFDMLKYYGVEIPDSKRLIKVSDSINRSAVNEGRSPIITPNSWIYIGHRCRLMHGLEALGLQGIHFGERQSRLLAYSNEFLFDLSGNAFHVLCCAASTVVKDALLAKCRSLRESGVSPAPRPAGSSVAPDVGDDSDSEDFEFVF
eukprot:8687868-Pyramimonas_sp.AAC.2